MNLKALEKDICYVIKEEQIKLGFIKESISLYYPLSSLNSILETECNAEEMLQALDEFKIKSKAEFGDIDVSVKGERFVLNYRIQLRNMLIILQKRQAFYMI